MERKLKIIVGWVTKHNYALALVIAACFVALTLGLGHYSNQTIPPNQDHNARYLAEPGTHLDFMSEWDGPHYIQIAQHGYSNKSLTAFFPLYPLAIRLVMFMVSSPLLSALIVSWLALAGSLWFYFKILKECLKQDRTGALQGLLLFLFFPTGVFLAATYSESLFAFLSLGAIYFGLKNRYLATGIMMGLATAARPDGLFVVALGALLLWEARAKLRQIVIAAAIGCSGIIGYIAYLSVEFHKPFAFVSAQKQHIKWLSSRFISAFYNSTTPMSVVLFVVALYTVIYWWNKRLSFAIFGLLFVLLPLASGNFAGYPRYLLIDFPLQLMLLNKFKNSRLGYALVLMLSVIGWAYFTMHYAAGYTGGS